MRAISAKGQVCGRGVSGGISKKPEHSGPHPPNQDSTVSFTGTDGKVLTFVKSSDSNVIGNEAGNSTATSPLWKRRRVTGSTEPDSKGEAEEISKDERVHDISVEDKPQPSAEKRTDGNNIEHSLSQKSYGTTLTESEEYFRKEDEFMFKQEIEKSKVRLKSGRGNELDLFLGDEGLTVPAAELFKDVVPELLKQHQQLLEAHIHFAKDEPWVTFLKAIEAILKYRQAGDTNGGEVSELVAQKIDDILAVKSLEELELFEAEIPKKLSSDEVVDVHFWELALSKIPFFKACCIIKEYKTGSQKESVQRPTPVAKVAKPKVELPVRKDAAYDKFMKSLKLEEDEHLLEEDVPYGNAEGIKPRYVVRVTTGFEWNKYNQSHFDMNNPPPKHITGLKFNLFFGELEGSGTTPKWNLVKDGDSKDTCLIVFKGGRSYSPVAFRIPNREWDTDYTRGFKNFFSNGVMHLYFNYRKLVYRR